MSLCRTDAFVLVDTEDSGADLDLDVNKRMARKDKKFKAET